VRRTFRASASERFEDVRQHLWGNRWAPFVDGERHRVALFLTGKGDRLGSRILRMELRIVRKPAARDGALEGGVQRPYDGGRCCPNNKHTWRP
jgi:hypothetical protein